MGLQYIWSSRRQRQVLDPTKSTILKDHPEPAENEITLGLEIVKKLTKDLDISVFKDSYRERIESMVQSKIKGEVVQLEKKAACPRPGT